MKTIQDINLPTLHTSGPIYIQVFAAGDPHPKKSSNQPEEPKVPVEPIAEKDEVKNAEEKTRKAQENVDRKKHKDNSPDK